MEGCWPFARVGKKEGSDWAVVWAQAWFWCRHVLIVSSGVFSPRGWGGKGVSLMFLLCMLVCVYVCLGFFWEKRREGGKGGEKGGGVSEKERDEVERVFLYFF